MRKTFLIAVFILARLLLYAGDSTSITIHFLYGSVPAKHHPEEKKWFGGLHGGHVTIEVNNVVYGFNPKGSYHIFPHRRKKHGAWYREKSPSFRRDSVGHRYTSFTIPVSDTENEKIDSILKAEYEIIPHDYSMFGFRCASSTWDVLEEIGILQRHCNLWKAWVIFYPRRIRKRMFRLADEKNWAITMHHGKKTRKWEKDKGKYGFHEK